MKDCPNCGTRIEQRYCPCCGTEHVPKRVTFVTLITDFIESVYSIDKSLWNQFRLMLLRPEKIIIDYWNGYRRYYLSPAKILLMATLFLTINFVATGGDFLGIKITVEGDVLSRGLVFFAFLFFIFVIPSSVVYSRRGRNFPELIIMNIYNLSFWVIVFSLMSILSFYLPVVEHSRLLMIVLVVYWNSRPFGLDLVRRIWYSVLNLVIIALLILGLYMISQ